MTTLANAEAIINEDYIADERSRASESQSTLNLQELDIQTPMKKDKSNKRSHDEETRMEVDTTTSSKRIKGSTKDQGILVLDLDESINQEEIGKGVMIQHENPKQESTSFSKQIVSLFILKTHKSSSILDI